MSAKDKPPSPAEREREAKLAQALRANLRRRKAPAKGGVSPSAAAAPDTDKRS